jgi:hypothetical protein
MPLSIAELQRGGVGQWAEIIAGIVGPLAEAGTTAYSTYAQQNLANKELKARQTEMTRILEQRKVEAELDARRKEQEAREAAERARGRGELLETGIKVGAGALVVIVTTALTVKAIRAALGGAKPAAKANPGRRSRCG